MLFLFRKTRTSNTLYPYKEWLTLNAIVNWWYTIRKSNYLFSPIFVTTKNQHQIKWDSSINFNRKTNEEITISCRQYTFGCILKWFFMTWNRCAYRVKNFSKNIGNIGLLRGQYIFRRFCCYIQATRHNWMLWNILPC